MKKNSIVFAGLLVGSSLFLLATNLTTEKIVAFDSKNFHQLNSGGASAGNTGAPGENNCAGCHSGGGNPIQDGGTVNTLDWGGDAAYTPGQTYSITLNFSEGSAKNGFQLTALKESDDTKAGELVITDDTRTNLLNGQFGASAGRQYISHKSAGTGVSSWTFDWTAPATDVGPVKFYVSTNKTNSNNGTSGDVVYLSQHLFNSTGATSFISEYEKTKASMNLFYQASTNGIQLDFTTEYQDDLHASVHNISGQVVYSTKLGKTYPGENNHFMPLPSIGTGVYIVHLFIGNNAFSQKVVVE